MSNISKNIVLTFISFLLLLSWWSSLTVGLSTDEYFHHINGMKRYNFLVSFGEDKNFQFRNNEFYPGLYDTLSYAIGQIILLINKKFYAANIDFVMHIVNVTFSTLSLLGLYLFTKKILNKDIAILAVLITLLNPFFFGHMGMNSKDLIVFFSLIWFTYYFYLYCVENENITKNLLLASFFMGFGCGVRLTFLVVIFPVVVSGIIYLINKYKSDYSYLIKRLSLHILVAFIITIFLVILCWPHIFVSIQSDNFFRFLSIIVKNTINWNDGPKTGIINGEYYEVFNTPKSYFLNIVLFRLPFYFSILLFFTYFLFFSKKLFLQKEINNFNLKFGLINLIAFFPIILALLLSVNIYDNLRLFLFIIPFFGIIAALSLHQILLSFRNSWKIKSFASIILILFSLSFYRFIILTPYQYDYINYSSVKLSNANEKWEHDYWGASYKELVLKIKENLNEEEIKNLKITNCSGDSTLLYYLFRHLGKKFIYRADREHLADHVILINRASLDVMNNPALKGLVNEKGHMRVKDIEKVVRTPGVKTRCPIMYQGEDIVKVERGGITLSALRKLDK